MENYEQKYKEALERARMINNGKDVDVEAGTTTCEYIFPELKESEDERIRKWLFNYVGNCPNENFEFYGGVGKKAVLSWLEKQKEHIPSTEETELNSLAFLTELGYTCIPPKAQKPAEWSEEDERKLNRIYEILGYAADDKGFLTSKRIIGDKEAIELQDFLKSLRPQTKQKWSEEDSRILYNVIAYIGYAAGQRGVRDDEFKEANSWLKSLPNGFIVNPNYNEDMVELLVAELQQDAERNGAPQQYSAEIAWLKSLRPQPKSELTLLDKN